MVGRVVMGVVIPILSVSRGRNILAAVTMALEFVLGLMREHVNHCGGGRGGERKMQTIYDYMCVCLCVCV